MKTYFEKYGQLEGEDLCELTLVNDQQMQVKLLNYGATLAQVIMPDGKNMILSLDKAGDYHQERNFLGGTVGRICGRVKSGQWQVGNKILSLPKNDGENEIHGGRGIDTRVWNFKLYCDQEQAKCDFYLFDPALNNGFVGNLKIHVSYCLNNANQLFYQIEAVSDELTIFNPANHTYFTLGDKAKNLILQLNADYYLPVGQDGLPVGGMQSVKNTVFDFTSPKPISQTLMSDDAQIELRRGLDHPFILNGNQPCAILKAADHQLSMTTDAPAIVTYTGNHFDHTGICHNIGQYDGITLEAQVAPKNDSKLDAITLMPNEKFQRKVCWSFI